jgi:hypothetical protein
MEAAEVRPTEATSRQISPEVVLWSAVVQQIFIDAFEASDSILADFKSWRLKADSDFDPEAIRAEARRWLVCDFDPWRADREDACDLAGFDPDDVRAIARKRLRVVREEEEKAKDEGREPHRSRYNSRHTRRFDVFYEERPADVARLAELESLDAIHRAAQRTAEAKIRGARMRAKNAKAKAERERQQNPEAYLNKVLAEAEEKKERRREYSRRWYIADQEKKRLKAEVEVAAH